MCCSNLVNWVTYTFNNSKQPSGYSRFNLKESRFIFFKTGQLVLKNIIINLTINIYLVLEGK